MIKRRCTVMAALEAAIQNDASPGKKSWMAGFEPGHDEAGASFLGCRSHGEARSGLCLPILRRGEQQVAGQMPILRHVEQPVPGGKRALCSRRRRSQGQAKSESRHHREPCGRGPRCAAHRFRHRRTRPGRRRRLRAGLCGALERRAWHRQIDAPASGCRGHRHPGPQRALFLR